VTAVAELPLSLTVVLGCGACYSQIVIEVPVVADGGHAWIVRDERLGVWRRSHHAPWARSA
jgi:hypothetical protein